VVPAKYYQQVGPDGFIRKPIGAGPYKLTSMETGLKLQFEAFEHYYRPVHIKNLTMLAVPDLSEYAKKDWVRHFGASPDTPKHIILFC
jgi:peptide/nickel transport system substrate-binding protein